MKKYKVLTVLGARPQFIKAAPVSLEINRQEKIEEIIIHTGQHYDDSMSGIFFRELGIPVPKYNLGISEKSHSEMIGLMIAKLGEIIMLEAPNLVLVYGDTNSTLSAAIAARKLNIPLAHIEAGLRNHDLSIPEDTNRVITDRISSYLFYSTDVALRNLKSEGFDGFPVKMFKTDDLFTDSTSLFSQFAKRPNNVPDDRFILATVHRESNTNHQSLRKICNALNVISEDCAVYFPAHLRTIKALRESSISLSKNIFLVEPISYLEMLYVLKKAEFVITDSGGLQREAYLFRKKSLLLMDYTPWEELVNSRYSALTEIDETKILSQYLFQSNLIVDFSKNLYGNGCGAKQIVSHLAEILL